MSVLKVVRVGIPLAMVVLGVGLILFGGDSATGAGVVIAGSAALVALASALVRFSIDEQDVRGREQDARDFYAEHGRWPDDPEPVAGPGAPPEPAAPPEPPAPAHPGVQSIPSPERTRRRTSRRPPRR